MTDKKKKVFLVEDDVAITDIYGTMIKKAHYDVDIMASGQEAMKKVKAIQAGEEGAPDIVLLDLILPDMNGTDILAAFKQHDATKNIKVFILTNQEESEMPETSFKPDKFIIKANITPTQLLELIKEQLQ